MAKLNLHLARANVQTLLTDRCADYDAVVDLAVERANAYQRYAQDGLTKAHTLTYDLLTHGGQMVPSGRSDIRNTKTTLKEVREDLDRVDFWDRIRLAALEMKAEARADQGDPR